MTEKILYKIELHAEVPDGNGAEWQILQTLTRLIAQLGVARQVNLRIDKPVKVETGPAELTQDQAPLYLTAQEQEALRVHLMGRSEPQLQSTLRKLYEAL